MSDSDRYSSTQSVKGYEVLSPDRQVVLRCGDEATAKHYAVMLNEAYSLGYKAGFREGLKG
jgi:hypothetical protein